MKLRTTTIAATFGLAILGSLAVSGPLRTVSLFEGTFDTPEILPEIGQFVASSSVGSIGIVAAPGGGSLLVFDDTSTNGSESLYLHGTFDGGKAPMIGVVMMHFEMTLGQQDTPFSVGVVVDNATSDFIPASGPDSDGDMNIAGKKSGKEATVNTALDVVVRLERTRPDEDWEYEISVSPITETNGSTMAPNPSAGPSTGSFHGTRGKPISGLAIIKPPGPTGRFFIDDITVDHSTD